MLFLLTFLLLFSSTICIFSMLPSYIAEGSHSSADSNRKEVEITYLTHHQLKRFVFSEMLTKGILFIGIIGTTFNWNLWETSITMIHNLCNFLCILLIYKHIQKILLKTFIFHNNLSFNFHKNKSLALVHQTLSHAFNIFRWFHVYGNNNKSKTLYICGYLTALINLTIVIALKCGERTV